MNLVPSAEALLLDADQRQGLIAVRSLGREGITVAALETRPRAPAFRSRWCVGGAVVPDFAHDPSAFVDGVLHWVEQLSPRAVIPAGDGSIAALRQRRAEIERRVPLAMAAEHALDVTVSKQRTLNLAAELGIRVPRAVPQAQLGDVRAAVDELGFPLVVKPTMSWVSRDSGGVLLRSRVVVNYDEAAEAVQSVLEAGCSVILQEWLSGSREAVSLFRAHGRIWARFAQVAARMYPPLGGSSLTRESIPLPPDLTPAAEQLVDAIDLDGYSEIEFRRDSEGRAALMEINPRLSASVEIAVRSGVNFPLLLFSWAAGTPLRPALDYRTGTRMRWLGGDIRWMSETLKSQGRPDVEPALLAVWHFLFDFFRPGAYDYLAWDDLLPAFVASAAMLRKIGHSRGSRPRRPGPPRSAS